jgi:hypothetical protein
MASPFLTAHPTSGGFISILLSKLGRGTFFIGRQKDGKAGFKGQREVALSFSTT